MTKGIKKHLVNKSKQQAFFYKVLQLNLLITFIALIIMSYDIHHNYACDKLDKSNQHILFHKSSNYHIIKKTLFSGRTLKKVI